MKYLQIFFLCALHTCQSINSESERDTCESVNSDCERMSTAKYTVTYFNYRWLAEPIRYLLSYVGEPFEDVRLDWDEWEKDENIKKAYPYGKLPILEDTESKLKLSQSFAIARYLATKYKLVGTTNEDAAKCDEYVDCVKDMLKEMELMNDEKRKDEVKVNIMEKTFPRYFSVIEEVLKKNGGKYLVGKGITWADFVLAHYSELFEQFVDASILTNYPTLKAHQKQVFDIPKIKEWITKRPVTEF